MLMMQPAAVVATAILAFVLAWALTRSLATRAALRARVHALLNADPKTYRRILALFQLGSELLGKIPKTGDSPLEVLAKLLAMGQAAEKVYGGKSTVYADIFARYDLRERTSAPFVQLFFSSSMARGLKQRRHGVSEHLELIEVETADGERVFFQELRYSRPEVSADFFHTPGFNFKAALDRLWKAFPHGMYLSTRPLRYGGSEPAFTALSAPRKDPITSKARDRITAAAEMHRAREGEPYCFIAYGPPGTGKTQYAVGLCKAIGARLLLVDASALPQIGVQELGFLLDAVCPGFLLIDDFDRAPIEETRARVLFLFKHFKDAHRDMTAAVTVNDPTKLDEALLRSERIDEAEAFDLPDLAERRELLGLLMAAPRFDSADKDALADETEGFSQADLGGLVRRAHREPGAAALVAMKRLRALAGRAAAAASSSAPDASSPQKPS